MERYRVVRIEEQMYGCEELPEGAEVCCDEILMDKIMKVVNEHLDDPALNVEMLASEVGLSRGKWLKFV